MAKHCDAPTLLRYLDAELTPAESAEVARHLAQCWRCRAECDQTREQITAVAAVFTQCEFPQPTLQRGLARLERTLPPPPPARKHTAFRAAIAILAAGFLAASVHFIHTPPPATVVSQPVKPPAPAPAPPLPAPIVRPLARIPKPIPPAPQPVEATIPAPIVNSRLPLLHVEVLYALHRAAADLGEPIQVSRGENSIVIEGVVDTRPRLSQILSALNEIEAGPLLTIRLQAAEDVPPLPPTQPTLTLDTPPAVPAILPLLESHDMRFSIAMAHSAIIQSTTALDHAWAIRRLEAALPPEDREHLPAIGRWLLNEIRTNHEEAIEASRQSIRTILTPILVLDTEPQPPPAIAPFNRALLLRDLVHSLFAGRRSPEGFSTPQAMLTALHSLVRN